MCLHELHAIRVDSKQFEMSNAWNENLCFDENLFWISHMLFSGRSFFLAIYADANDVCKFSGTLWNFIIANTSCCLFLDVKPQNLCLFLSLYLESGGGILLTSIRHRSKMFNKCSENDKWIGWDTSITIQMSSVSN